jgi:four helix bundle protein
MTFKFEQMETWQKSIAWADKILELSEGFPQRYQYSLGDQIRRAALSVPTNLAEGSGRDNPRERKYFYAIAKGSAYETVSLLIITKNRHLLDEQGYQQFYITANEIAAMISGLIKAAEREMTNNQIREIQSDYTIDSNTNSKL